MSSEGDEVFQTNQKLEMRATAAAVRLRALIRAVET